MAEILVRSSQPLTLLGGGAVAPGDLAFALSLAPFLVAADGGADLALAEGHMPQAVIGDFDSVSEAALRAIPAEHLFRRDDQDTTDFDKCLATVQAPLILGLGFLGVRLDHQMAALSGLMQRPQVRCILIGAHDIVFLCPPQLRIDLPAGMRFSLYPMAPVQGESDGLRWPIDGLTLAPGGRIGTSNEVAGGPVAVRVPAPGMMVILPRAALGAAIAALTG